MAVPPADDGGRALSAPAGAQGTRLRLLVTAALALALLAATGVLGLVLWERRGEAEEVQAERDRVMAQSEQFLLRIGTFGPDLLEGDQMPEFRARVSEVLTPKATVEFEEQAVVAEQLVAQQEAARSAEVFGTGVSVLDEDSATALVAGAFTNAVAGDAGAPFPVYLRLELVKVDGEWLVDDFGSAVTDGAADGESEEGGGALPPVDPATDPADDPADAPTDDPTDDPTDEATP